MMTLLDQPKKIFSGLALVTCALIVHVHTQIAIFQVSYAIQKKEKLIAELSDEYRVRKFEVSKLHSFNYLDKRKKEMNLKLVVPKEVNVIGVPVEKEMPRINDSPSVVQKGLFSFVNLIKEAQAKTSR